jgi:hypothetical protein
LSWPFQESGTIQNLYDVYFLDADVGFACGDSGIILKTLNGGIPVELTSFSANVINYNVTLNWTTASEINNKGFEIEKLEENENWQRIGFVEGNGTTTEIKIYSFEDKNVAPGKYQYRLKQIDFDGTFEYSHTIETEVGLPVNYNLYQNYPNPFNPKTKIKFEIPMESFVTLIIYDAIGNELSRLVNQKIKAGIHEIDFNADESYSSGIYFYELKAENGSSIFFETKKMILIK